MNPRGVPWLSSEQAAIHIGYVKPDGTANLDAFYMFVSRERRKPKTRLRVHWLRGRMRFRQTELDALLEPEPAHGRQSVGAGPCV